MDDEQNEKGVKSEGNVLKKITGDSLVISSQICCLIVLVLTSSHFWLDSNRGTISDYIRH